MKTYELETEETKARGWSQNRFHVSFFTESGSQVESEWLNTKAEAIAYAKSDLRHELKKHGVVLYAEISNMMNSKAPAIKIELTDEDYMQAGYCPYCKSKECESDHK